jgi:hypothetical protein
VQSYNNPHRVLDRVVSGAETAVKREELEHSRPSLFYEKENDSHPPKYNISSAAQGCLKSSPVETMQNRRDCNLNHKGQVWSIKDLEDHVEGRLGRLDVPMAKTAVQDVKNTRPVLSLQTQNISASRRARKRDKRRNKPASQALISPIVKGEDGNPSPPLPELYRSSEGSPATPNSSGPLTPQSPAGQDRTLQQLFQTIEQLWGFKQEWESKEMTTLNANQTKNLKLLASIFDVFRGNQQ